MKLQTSFSVPREIWVT